MISGNFHTHYTLLRTPITGYKNKELEWRARQLVWSPWHSSAVCCVDYTHNICCLLLFAFAFCRHIHVCVSLPLTLLLSLCVCAFIFILLLVLKYHVARFFPSAYTVDLNVFHPPADFFPFLFSVSVCCWFFFCAFSRGLFVVLFFVCVLFFFSWLPVGLTVELSISR